MNEEKFDFKINGINYKVKSSLNTQSNYVTYSVWKDENLFFEMFPKLDENDEPSWAVMPPYQDQNIDMELVRRVGNIIENNEL